MTGKTAPGRMPDYTPAHLLYALNLLNEDRIGRKQLSDMLRVGEGTVRTIISRFSDARLIIISRPGVTLSKEGTAFLSKIQKRMTWGQYPSTDLTVAEANCVVLVKDASDKIRFGVEQRDQALIHGAVGATTLMRVNDIWVMPGQGEPVEFPLSLDEEPKDGDVVIIGSGEDEFSARLGALSAALKLFL